MTGVAKESNRTLNGALATTEPFCQQGQLFSTFTQVSSSVMWHNLHFNTLSIFLITSFNLVYDQQLQYDTYQDHLGINLPWIPAFECVSHLLNIPFDRRDTGWKIIRTSRGEYVNIHATSSKILMGTNIRTRL